MSVEQIKMNEVFTNIVSNDKSRIIGNWIVGKTIGSGSMGKVKLAKHNINKQYAAVKLIPRTLLRDGNVASSYVSKKEQSCVVRILREAAIVNLLQHPNICSIIETLVTQTYFCLFFEFIDGWQMLDYIIAHGKLREKLARKFARQIASALYYCHSNSIVHRGN